MTTRDLVWVLLVAAGLSNCSDGCSAVQIKDELKEIRSDVQSVHSDVEQLKRECRK